MIYIDVIVPLPLTGVFTYLVPKSMEDQIGIGHRVIVQFGKKKYYTAIIHQIHDSNKNTQTEIKEIISVLDDKPIVLPTQLELWQWISSYYMCTLGEVMKAALPSVLKLESETFVLLEPDCEYNGELSFNEQQVLNVLSKTKPLKISEIEKSTGISNPIYYIKSLVDKQIAYISEKVKDKYSAKTEIAYCLAKEYTDLELQVILDDLQRAKKQQHVFAIFIHLKLEAGNRPDFFILKKDLIRETQSNSSTIESLVEKGILKNFLYEVGRFEYNDIRNDIIKELNADQKRAYTEINSIFEDKQTILLHGVTSSGKTEVYIHLIKDAIARGEQVLYLVPEISLTPQITDRLRAVFGSQLFVYHSKFNDNERADIWQSLLNRDECKIILGARSSIFLPFRKLGLIIVDEEHESSYKQQDPAPRYNAKNAAIVLASLFNAHVLLGTATPSIETYYNALSDRFGLVSITKRYADIELPQITIVNTKDLRKRKLMKTIISPPLLVDIETTLSKSEQVILFQNRRGFAPLLECKTCSWTPKCLHCDVSLTLHKGQRIMVCHYCSAVYSIPKECPECKTPTLEVLGYGTERIEELIHETLPQANAVRMDLDTTRSKRAYEKIISDFELNHTNVLIGTQMVSKGLDFENVSLVGVLNADSMLNYPDFRAHERAFQLMIQVSGRAGRKNKQGTVVIQTAHPGHPIISYIKNNDYKSLYEMQIGERKLFKYPPFFRLIEIVLKGRDESAVEKVSANFSKSLRHVFGDRVLGPTRPIVARIQSLYIRKILLKIENQAPPTKVRELIESCRLSTFENSPIKSVFIYYDVDPM